MHPLHEELGSSNAERRKGYRAPMKGWLMADAMKGLMDRRTVYGSEAFERRVGKKHKLHAKVRPVGRPKMVENE